MSKELQELGQWKVGQIVVVSSGRSEKDSIENY